LTEGSNTRKKSQGKMEEMSKRRNKKELGARYGPQKRGPRKRPWWDNLKSTVVDSPMVRGGGGGGRADIGKKKELALKLPRE